MQKLQNKRVLITGGSNGIGQAIALSYAREGAIVAFTYHRHYDNAMHTLREIESLGHQGFAIQANMANPCDVDQLVPKSVESLGGLDILVNNAGTLTRHTDFLDITTENFEHVQAVNIKAPFILTQQAAKQMCKQNSGGSIINISSISAEIITPGLTHYECSKAAMNALTRSAASALAPHNIRVNAIAPGLVTTNINKQQRENDPSAWLQRSSQIPLGRVGQPNDIATIALLLASEDAQWITGAIIPVDGGIGIRSPYGELTHPSKN